jgi:hypothetical protein
MYLRAYFKNSISLFEGCSFKKTTDGSHEVEKSEIDQVWVEKDGNCYYRVRFIPKGELFTKEIVQGSLDAKESGGFFAYIFNDVEEKELTEILSFDYKKQEPVKIVEEKPVKQVKVKVKK